MRPNSPDDFRDTFFQECEELLEAMHDGFDLMAAEVQEPDTIHAVFRAVHSIKGGAGAFGLDALVAFAHHFETALEMLRGGKVEADAAALELFQQCGDHLSDLVGAARDGVPVASDLAEGLRERLNDVIGHDPAAEPEAMPEFEPQMLDFDLIGLDDPAPAAGFAISFAAMPGLFASGNEPAALFRALERLGTLTVSADLSQVPPLGSLDPARCAITWSLTLLTEVGEVAVREVFDFVEDCCRLEITPLGADGCPAGGPAVPLPTLAEVLAQGSREAGGPAPPAAGPTDPAGAAGAPSVPPARAPCPAALPRETSGAAEAGRDRGKGSGATIRVDLERVDKLINLVGELVIKEAMLSQSISTMGLPSESDVAVALDSLKQLAGEIQEGVMAIRAQPVKPMFQRMARIVREAATATGKRVRFVTHGDYTEVDKTVVERLIDPLTHMVRNAVDHGLESPEARIVAGKSPEGTVTLAAAHRSGRVMIDVSDDGGGINRERVREIAEDKGLIPRGMELSAADIDNLLFLPGFSSKTEVSELSGRGVGLDVVRSEIQALGGRVAIQSTPGYGTSFSISLPLTLAVMEGMVIDLAGQTMVVPITAIQETLQPRSVTIHQIGASGRVLENRDALVPIVDLAAVFGFRAPLGTLDRQVLLLIETDAKRRCALIVDRIQDQRQVVIKSLETNLHQVEGIAAATILGDGRIALIIDPDDIVRSAGPAPTASLSAAR